MDLGILEQDCEVANEREAFGQTLVARVICH